MKKFIALFLALVMVFALCACGSKTEAPKTDTPKADTPKADAPKADTPKTDAPPQGNTSTETPPPVEENEYISVRIGIPSEIGDLMTSGAQADCYAAMDAVFDIIFYCDPVTRDWTPDVLTDWYMEDDNHMVLKMRDDIYFNNGEHATAEDLLFSYLCHTEDGLDHWIKAMKIRPDECTIRDDYTVVMAVDAKSQDFYSRDNKLFCKKWVKEVGWDNPEAWYYPVGSGPYYVSDYKAGDSITLKLRDDYWLRPAEDYYVDEYVITQYADTTTAYMALEIGDIDFCKVAKTEFARVMSEGADADLAVAQIATGVTTNFYMPAHINSVWADKRVREAVFVGVDWVELDKIMYGELAKPATSVTPSDSPLYINPGPREFDLEKAKALLAEAGYGPGDITLKTSLFESAAYKAFGEAITYYLDQIGIKADVSFGDTASVLAVWNAGQETDFAMHVNPAGSPGRNICQSIQGITGENVSFTEVKNNDRVRELWSQMAPLYDAPLSEKKAIAEELQQLIYDEILVIPFHEENVAVAFNAKVYTENIIQSFTTSDNNYKLSRMGLRANWE